MTTRSQSYTSNGRSGLLAANVRVDQVVVTQPQHRNPPHDENNRSVNVCVPLLHTCQLKNQPEGRPQHAFCLYEAKDFGELREK